MRKSNTTLNSGKERDQLGRLGESLRACRIDHGYTLGELAGQVRVTKGYLSRVERGSAKPSRKLIDALARLLQADPSPFYLAAGYLPEDLKYILDTHPLDASAMLREAFSGYGTGSSAPSGPGASPLPGLEGRKHTPYEIVRADCFDWMKGRASDSIHAIVTDPPYGLVEFSPQEKEKLRNGRGGIWRIPPTLGGHTRKPLPRFSVLGDREKVELCAFFAAWASEAIRIVVPGGHVFIATNPLLSHVLYTALEAAGFEKRGEVIRLVQTLRGGDRPKNAHEEFDMVTVMPRSCWEPWGLFRRPCEGRVQDNLRKWRTGGLRRESEARPFCDVIPSAPARGKEREIAPHPSLKPQAFMRQIVRAALPLGEGVVLDPFMGSGSTIAAASAVGYQSIGVESDSEFFAIATRAIPRLAALRGNENSNAAKQQPGRPAREQHDPSLFL